MPGEITLIVKHCTSGAALPHADTGEIQKVILDGVERAPKSTDFGAATFWLQVY